MAIVSACSALISSILNYGEIYMEQHFRDKDAAQYAGVGKSTIWLWASQGKLHPVKLSPRVTIFLKSDVDAFIASRIGAVS